MTARTPQVPHAASSGWPTAEGRGLKGDFPARASELSIEPATLDDAEAISRLVGYWADRGEMLHRPVSEVYEAVRDFKVARLGGELVGCASLHIMGRDLAEVRSLAVAEDAQARGFGAALVRACL